jgi:hypothetical protein
MKSVNGDEITSAGESQIECGCEGEELLARGFESPWRQEAI